MGVGLRTPQFLTCEQDAGESSVLVTGLFTTGKRAHTMYAFDWRLKREFQN